MIRSKNSLLGKPVIFLVLLILSALLGCSGNGGNTLTPDLSGSNSPGQGNSPDRILWGMWQVSIDANSMTAEMIPVRGAEFTANVTRFMQPPISPTNMVSLLIDPSSDPASGYFALDITLKHPFPGMNMYNGFDVRGILMANGSITGLHDIKVLRSGDGDTRLLNPDGYTRWWNWVEFTSYEKIFGATQGKLAPPIHPNSTVNAFKYFADGLGSKDLLTALDPASRGFFTTNAPGVNKRRYEIQFKMNGGQTVFDFNYAVDASWALPDSSYAPNYPVEAFDLSANCQEAYNVVVTDGGSDAWYVNDTDKGGELIVDIEVFDWQGGAKGDVPSEVSAIYLEGNPLSGVVDVLSSATILPGTTVNSSVYQVSIGTLNLTASGDFKLFGTVENTDPNTYKPQIIGGGAFAYPDAPLAAYFTCIVHVDDVSPGVPPAVNSIDPDSGVPDCSPEHVVVTGANFIDGETIFWLQRAGEPNIYAENIIYVDSNTMEGDLNLSGALPGLWDVVVENPGGMSDILEDGFTVLDVFYVDGDNIGDPMMDGSQDHPFDTIQKGIDAGFASKNEPVIVDQCAVHYGTFSLKNNSHVIGCNWNDGIGWPTVNQTNAYTYGNNVTNVIVEGLFFDIKIDSGDNGVSFSGGNGITITGCKFSGVATAQYGYFLVFNQSSNVEIAYSEFTGIYHRGPDINWRALMAAQFLGTNGVHIHHCEFHDIGFDIPDAGAFGNSLIVIRVGYGTITPHNLDIHNVLIYNIFDKTNCIRPSPNPDPQNWLSVFSLANVNSFDWVGYFRLRNITVDNIRHADPPSTTIVNAGHCNAAYMGMVGGEEIDWKNNIVSNIIPTNDNMWAGNSSYYGWWVDMYINNNSGYGPQLMHYSNIFNVGNPLPPGANMWQWNSGYVNQCQAGTGSYQNYQDINPQYDMTPGANFYHPTNPLVSQGADDGTEMGAFGGPEGDWIPPSQLD